MLLKPVILNPVKLSTEGSKLTPVINATNESKFCVRIGTHIEVASPVNISSTINPTPSGSPPPVLPLPTVNVALSVKNSKNMLLLEISISNGGDAFGKSAILISVVAPVPPITLKQTSNNTPPSSTVTGAVSKNHNALSSP